jgi:hypothetical protein
MLCTRCTEALRDDLLEASFLLETVVITITRQSRTGTGSGGGDAIPFDPKASYIAAGLRSEISGWVRVLLDDGHGTPDVIDDPAAWLATQTPIIRARPWALDCQHGVGRHIKKVRDVVFPPDLTFICRCGATTADAHGNTGVCGHVVYARDGSDIGKCRCGATYDKATARTKLLDDARHETYPAATISRLLAANGLTVPVGTIRQWKNRGHLAHAGYSPDGRPLYRLGDVLDRATRHATTPGNLQVSAL